MMAKPKIKDVRVQFKPIHFQHPLVLGKGSIKDITLARVEIDVEDHAGRRGTGKGEVLLSDLWSQPPFVCTSDLAILDPLTRHFLLDEKMRETCLNVATVYSNQEFFTPLVLYSSLKEKIEHLGTAQCLVPLATTIAVAPLDYALWEAYGDLKGRSIFTLVEDELSGKYGLHDPLFHQPLSHVRVLHTLGMGDALTSLKSEDRDFPSSLESWLRKEGTTAVKIKLRGDVQWDVERVRAVNELIKDLPHFCYSVDMNESYESVDQFEEFMSAIAKTSHYSKLWFVEQPMRRGTITSLTANVQQWNVPIVADESLVYPEDVGVAAQQGYTGIALKSPARGFSNTVLQFLEAKKRNMFVTIQDLTNPNLALRHHLDFARRIIGLNDPVEMNARQYVHQADRDSQFSSLYDVVGGYVDMSKVL